MATAVNAGARLDRLPISSFHYRIFWLVGAGMFFDGYDLYVAGRRARVNNTDKILDAAAESAISLVDVRRHDDRLFHHRFRRRQIRSGASPIRVNLLVFGLASIAAAFAQDMTQLIICRFIQGLGLGAEIVVGYSTLTEFVPPATRGRWLAFMAFLVVAGFPGDRHTWLSDHSDLGMAADVHHRRHRLSDRLVPPQELAGVAAMAGSAGPHGRG